MLWMDRQFGFAAALSCTAMVSACGATSTEERVGGPADGERPLLGARGPEFARRAVGSARTVSLHSLAGKVAIVDFWATWCAPCRKSFPKLETLRIKYQGEGLEVVGISEDDDEQGIAAFGADLGAGFPLLWDEHKSIASKWRPTTMPSTFVVDRAGTVRYAHFGYREGEDAEIEREIKELL